MKHSLFTQKAPTLAHCFSATPLYLLLFYYLLLLYYCPGQIQWCVALKKKHFLIDFFSRLFYVFTEEKLLILHSLTMRGKLFEPFLSVSDVILVSLVHC